MTAVTVSIVSPADGAFFVGPTGPTLRGSAIVPPELAGVPLYYRWYSSLFKGSTAPNRFSINPAAFADPDPVVPFTPALEIGSQALTLAVTDRPGEADSEPPLVLHGGAAGGSQGGGRVIIHLLRAILLSPANAAVLSKGAPLEARVGGPFLWEKPDYQAVNRLAYRLKFAPVGNPPGRASGQIGPLALTLDPGGTWLNFSGSYPAVGTGSYRLTLRVEDRLSPTTGDEASITVTLTA